ncbi:MAG: hypothetical protein ACRECD_15940 [Burkholderiaceae bacterium]
MNAIERIRQGQSPLLADERQALLHRLATELLAHHRISEATYRAAISRFGERVLVEVVGALGYYALVAMTLNAFEMCIPE